MTEKQSLIDNGTLSDIRHIVPDEVLESDMSCGGRLALDSHLRSIEKRDFDCNACEARNLCLLGLAKAKK